MMLLIITRAFGHLCRCGIWSLCTIIFIVSGIETAVKYSSNNLRNDSITTMFYGHRNPTINNNNNNNQHIHYMNSSSTSATITSSNRSGGRINNFNKSGGGSGKSIGGGNRNTWSIDGGRLIRTRGDIILGGIFPMHEHNNYDPEYPCGMVKEEKGIQRLEAMMYALDIINMNDPDLLPNVTLGSLIIDSCSSDTYALEQSMEFVRYYMNQDMSEYKCENGKPPMFVPHKPVAGVIGASFSVVSIMVANILRLFRIPQISYASTSTELSDKSRFEYFSRVVPPDNYQAQAIAEIVKSFDWRYTSTVAVEGEYGEKGIASFIQTANGLGICVAVAEKVSRHSKPEDFDRIIENLYNKPQARVVVMFVDEDNVRKLLQASIRLNKTGHFIWIGSDSWGAKSHPVRDQEFAAVNTITVLPQRTNLEGFDKYFRSLRPRLKPEQCTQTGVNQRHPTDPTLQINCRNIWFNEFWSQHHKCSFEPGARIPCTGDETLTNYEQEGLVPFVVDAVYAMAHALHKNIKETCGDVLFNDCDALQPAPLGADILRSIREVSFVGRQGTQIRFNQDGDAYGYYNIYQYQRHGKKYDYIQIGTWKEALELRNESLRWEGSVGTPKSICSDPCPIGHVHNHQDQCCWSCVKCREDAFVKNDTCISCQPGWAPNERKNGCDKLKAEVIDWWSPWAYVPLLFASIGILATTFTICVFIKFNHTPVIMASGRELCYVLLSGVLCCYGMTFVILARPTVNRCACLRIGLGLCLSLCYSAIFVKTNRISRIFNCGVKAVSRPIYTSPISQVAICLCIVSVQLLGTIGWLVYENPDVKEIHPQPLTAVLTCKVSTFSLIMSLVYNMVLILLCTLYAFKTRKIPENFNEAKYIGFTMYSTCIVWLAFLPIYFGTNNDYKIQVSSMCMCLMISATVSLTCLFLPKVYLVLFQPYKNVRNAAGLSVNRLAAADSNRPANCMRFSATRSQTFHSMTSSAITKSGSSSRLSHRVVNNANNSDDVVDTSGQTEQQQHQQHHHHQQLQLQQLQLQQLQQQQQQQQKQQQKQQQNQQHCNAAPLAATVTTATITSTNCSTDADKNQPIPCCSRTLHSEQPSQQAVVDTATPSQNISNAKDVSGVNYNNIHNNNNSANAEGISSVSSSSVNNLNTISSINLEPDFIEAVIEDYKNYSI